MNSLAVQSTAEEHHASNSNSYELFRSTRDRFSFELLSFKQKMVKEIWKLFDMFDPPKVDPFSEHHRICAQQVIQTLIMIEFIEQFNSTNFQQTYTISIHIPQGIEFRKLLFHKIVPEKYLQIDSNTIDSNSSGKGQQKVYS